MSKPRILLQTKDIPWAFADYNQDVDNLTIIASSNNRAVKNVVERLSKEIEDNFLFLEGGNKNLIRSNTIIEIQRALKWLDNNQFDPHKLQKLKQKLLELSGKFLIEEHKYLAYYGRPKWYSSILDILRPTIKKFRRTFPGILTPLLDNLIYIPKEDLYKTFYSETSHDQQTDLFEISLQYLHQIALQRKKEVKTALETYREYLTGDRDAYKSLGRNYRNYLSNISLVFPVITSTLHSVSNMLPFPELESVDQIVIDEAGMIPQHLVFPLLVRGRRAIIVGDLMQIEPVVQHSYQTLDEYKERMFISAGLEEQDYNLYSPAAKLTGTAFHRSAGANGDINDSGSCIVLREHFRCQEDIAEFCNQIARYKFEIKTEYKKPIFGHYLIACHVDGKIEDKVNLEEISAVEELIEFLIKQKYTCCNSNGESEIGVISPFRIQADRLQSKLKSQWQEFDKQSVGTVHTFQGGEKKVIILSTRICQPTDQGINFINNRPNLLNVAVSRAKELFILVGNLDSLAAAGGYTANLIKHIDTYGCKFRSVSDFTQYVNKKLGQTNFTDT